MPSSMLITILKSILNEKNKKIFYKAEQNVPPLSSLNETIVAQILARQIKFCVYSAVEVSSA